jgi:hypothetical protein
VRPAPAGPKPGPGRAGPAGRGTCCWPADRRDQRATSRSPRPGSAVRVGPDRDPAGCTWTRPGGSREFRRQAEAAAGLLGFGPGPGGPAGSACHGYHPSGSWCCLHCSARMLAVPFESASAFPQRPGTYAVDSERGPLGALRRCAAAALRLLRAGSRPLDLLRAVCR